MTSIAGKLARQKARDSGLGSNQNAVKFCKQDFEALKAQCLEQKRLFEDDCFPTGARALGFKELGPLSSKTKGVVWKRPTELCPNPRFIDNGATRTDICQGALGDCWLLAAIASLTLDDKILARVVPPGQSFEENYAGIFHFQFWQFGEWVDVVIDDRLPTQNGKLLFVQSAEGSEFWSALLEKAYAKVNGCYEALSGGTTTEGFEDFTGGIAEGYELNDAPPQLFKIIQRALELGSLLGCSIDISSARETEAITTLKLVKGHAYSVTGAEEVHLDENVVELVRLRNPWGHVEWSGAWSDNSSEWERIPEEKARLDKVADDGEFWMAYTDFIRHFSKLEICNLTPDTLASDESASWNFYQFGGSWRVGSTAGGCRNYSSTFCSNPQFAIKLEDVDDDPFDGEDLCTILVGLMQKDVRKDIRLGQDLNTIGFAIYEVPKEYKGRTDLRLGPDVLLKRKAVASCKTFTNLREVCDRFRLPPGEYVIVPSTFEPHKRGSFILRVFTEKQADTSLMDHNISVNVQKQKILESDLNPQFKRLYQEFAENGSAVTPFQLIKVLNKSVAEKFNLKTTGFSFDTCRNIVSLLDKNGTGKLGLTEFHILWTKIERYQEIFRSYDKDNTGAISTYKLRGALTQAGFQFNSAVFQVVVGRYSGQDCTINFDGFLGCLIRLETLFRMFNALDDKKCGKIELDMLQWFSLALH